MEPFDPMTLQATLPANAALIPADALRAGTRLQGYEIGGVIARSAIAMVYRAQDLSSGQVVAIKEFLPTGLAVRGDEGQVTAREATNEQKLQVGLQVFLDEANALAKQEHACLMPVLRVMECHGTAYKVMPYCPGPTLLEHRQKMSAAPAEQQLRAWFDGLLGALAQLHETGRVHGAVSPGNILMLSDDRPVLLDSDAVSAAILSERTRSMIAALEPCFAPPEQCEPAPAKPIGPWTDLFALAATMRFCASGQLPGNFAQRTQGGWFAPKGRRAGSPVEQGDSASPSWRSALDACLADAAKDRPQSVAQLTRWPGAGRPPRTAPMALATTGLAPLLSSPVPKTPVSVVPPVQSLPKAVAGDRGTDAQGDLPGPGKTSTGVGQLPLPLGVPDPEPAGRPDEVVDVGESRRSEAAVPLDAALQGSPEPSRSADLPAVRGTTFPIAKVAGLVVLAAMVAAAVTMLKGTPPPGTQAAERPVATKAAVPPVPPAVAVAPMPASPRQAVAVAEPPPSVRPAAKVDAPMARSAAPSPRQSKAASPNESRKPVAATEKGPQSTAAKSPANDGSPRQACAGKERYALLQCMETQCSKKAWTKHEQCVRLSRDRKL